MKYSFIILLILLISCVDPEIEEANEDLFFDSSTFVDEYFIQKNKQIKNVQKQITFGEKTDTLEIANYDITEDLENFKAVNINRVSWYDKYSVDTLNFQEGQQIRYQAIDPKMKTRNMEVNLIDNQVQSFYVVYENKSIISNTKKILTLDVDKGYSMSNELAGKLTKSRDLKIDVVFKSN